MWIKHAFKIWFNEETNELWLCSAHRHSHTYKKLKKLNHKLVVKASREWCKWP